MPGRRLLSPSAAWIALLALLLASIAPAVSHALAARQATATAFWAEICSASGGQRHQIVLASGADEAPAPPWPGMQACPYCLAQADQQGPPPVAGAVPPPAAAGFLPLPRLVRPFPPPLAEWRLARSRAPPVLS